MSRVLFYVVFISVALAVLVGAHLFLYLRLVRDTQLPAPWRQITTVLLAALFLSQPALFAVRDLLPTSVSRAVMPWLYVWMGMLLYLVLLFALGDLVKLGAWLLGKLGSSGGPALADPGRRLVIARAVAGATLVGTAGIAVIGRRNAVGEVQVRRVEVVLDRLPPAFDGLTVAQLTDIHLGPTLGQAWMERVVDRTNALGADVVAVTGDLVDGPVSLLRPDAAPLGRLFVTGNHEYYVSTEQWLDEVRRLGMQVLRNERLTLRRDGAVLHLAGVDDYNARRHLPDHGPDLERALDGVGPGEEVVLLAHQPREVFRAAARDVGLVLSGHTHGGQFWPWNYLVLLQQPYVMGLHRHAGARTQIYVSQGTGFWGPPMRIRTRGEITHLTLRSGRS